MQHYEQSKIAYFFQLENDEERLDYFFNILYKFFPSFVYDIDKFKKFSMVWREDIIKISYFKKVYLLICQQHVKNNLQKYDSFLQERFKNNINFWGVKYHDNDEYDFE